jgi:signal transduction histidine kinase
MSAVEPEETIFRWARRFERKSRTLIGATTLAVVTIVGLIDYQTGGELSFSVFYLLAVGLATWFVGKSFAVFVSFLSVAVSLAGDLAVGQRYSSPLVPWWNASIVLVVYFVIVWLLAKLRAFYRELDARVKERTAALRGEMAERERLEKEILEISEREQRRIGHDLHDSLGQHLTGAALAGQVLEEKLSNLGLPQAADANKVVELVEEGIALSRKLAKGLHPIEMGPEGLMQALEELAGTSTGLFDTKCRFECDSPVLVRDAAASGHLYRIAQEAVSNAVKHGKAKKVTIQLEALDNGVILRIKDDGIGLPDILPKTAGMGLRIMAHRASMIDGIFEAKRSDSGGTMVSCELRQSVKVARSVL